MFESNTCRFRYSKIPSPCHHDDSMARKQKAKSIVSEAKNRITACLRFLFFWALVFSIGAFLLVLKSLVPGVVAIRNVRFHRCSTFCGCRQGIITSSLHLQTIYDYIYIYIFFFDMCIKHPSRSNIPELLISFQMLKIVEGLYPAFWFALTSCSKRNAGDFLAAPGTQTWKTSGITIQ